MSRLKKIIPATPINLTGRYTEQQLWGVRTYIPLTDEVPAIAVCCNEHRNTCIRVSVGRKKTAYIPMEASGLHVVRVSHDAFKHEWSSLLVEYTPQVAARIFLNSMAAAYYISEEARTLLEEISSHGAVTSTIKENNMSKPAKAVKPSTTTKAKGSATPPKAAKPAAKGAKVAVKPAAQRYAGKKIKALFKPAEVGAREGSYTHFLIMSALKSATTEEVQKKIDADKTHAGKRADFGWLVSKQYISLS